MGCQWIGMLLKIRALGGRQNIKRSFGFPGMANRFLGSVNLSNRVSQWLHSLLPCPPLMSPVSPEYT
jgi:hypothetical protein